MGRGKGRKRIEELERGSKDDKRRKEREEEDVDKKNGKGREERKDAGKEKREGEARERTTSIFMQVCVKIRNRSLIPVFCNLQNVVFFLLSTLINW